MATRERQPNRPGCVQIVCGQMNQHMPQHDDIRRRQQFLQAGSCLPVRPAVEGEIEPLAAMITAAARGNLSVLCGITGHNGPSRDLRPPPYKVNNKHGHRRASRARDLCMRRLPASWKKCTGRLHRSIPGISTSVSAGEPFRNHLIAGNRFGEDPQHGYVVQLGAHRDIHRRSSCPCPVPGCAASQPAVRTLCSSLRSCRQICVMRSSNALRRRNLEEIEWMRVAPSGLRSPLSLINLFSRGGVLCPQKTIAMIV